MRLIDQKYTQCPFYGTRKMRVWLATQGHKVNRKRVRRLMRLMGLEAIYPKPKTTIRDQTHRIYPYLLRDVVIERPDQVWSTDITYVPMKAGFMYLAAVIDWHSRFVVCHRLSNTLDSDFCVDMLREALGQSKPEIAGTDQGSQFTSRAFTSQLERHGVKVSMDGKGRCLDNVFVERLWRSVKYENIYLHCYENVAHLQRGLEEYFAFYNNHRVHQALDYQTPAQVYQPEKRRR